MKYVSPIGSLVLSTTGDAKKYKFFNGNFDLGHGNAIDAEPKTSPDDTGIKYLYDADLSDAISGESGVSYEELAGLGDLTDPAKYRQFYIAEYSGTVTAGVIEGVRYKVAFGSYTYNGISGITIGETFVGVSGVAGATAVTTGTDYFVIDGFESGPLLELFGTPDTYTNELFAQKHLLYADDAYDYYKPEVDTGVLGYNSYESGDTAEPDFIGYTK